MKAFKRIFVCISIILFVGNGNRKMTHRGNPNLTRPLVKKSIPILLFTAERIPE